MALFRISNFGSSVRRFATSPAEPSIAGLGKKAKKLLAEGIQKKTKVPLEKDSKKLVTEVCGTNLLAEGGENIKIKADSEYPDWLWNVPLGQDIPLEKMDPNTKEYWNKVNYLGKQRDMLIRKIQRYRNLNK